jgi:hypothetical protein
MPKRITISELILDRSRPERIARQGGRRTMK